MNDTGVLFKRLHKDAVIPEYETDGSAGCDLRVIEDYVIYPMKIILVRTGFAMELKPGTEGQVRPRSGLAVKKGLTVINAPGTIDSDYRGEVKVGLINLGDTKVSIKKGDAVAQLVISPVLRGHFIPEDNLSYTDRGDGGFGSTGR